MIWINGLIKFILLSFTKLLPILWNTVGSLYEMEYKKIYFILCKTDMTRRNSKNIWVEDLPFVIECKQFFRNRIGSHLKYQKNFFIYEMVIKNRRFRVCVFIAAEWEYIILNPYMKIFLLIKWNQGENGEGIQKNGIIIFIGILILLWYIN